MFLYTIYGQKMRIEFTGRFNINVNIFFNLKNSVSAHLGHVQAEKRLFIRRNRVWFRVAFHCDECQQPAAISRCLLQEKSTGLKNLILFSFLKNSPFHS